MFSDDSLYLPACVFLSAEHCVLIVSLILVLLVMCKLWNQQMPDAPVFILALSPLRHLNSSCWFGINLEHGLGRVSSNGSKISNGVPHGKGMGNKGVPLGIKTTGFESASSEGSFPDFPQQRVVDVPVGDGCQEDESIGVEETQRVHLLLMLPQHLEHLLIQRHNPFFARLGSRGDEPMGCKSIDPEGLVNQQFSIRPMNAIPGECPEFPVTQTSAQPKQKEGIEPIFVALEILQDCLDLMGAKDIGESLGWLDFEGAGEEVPALGKDTSKFSEDADDGLIFQTLLLHPGNEEVNVLAVSQGLAVFQKCPVGMNGSTLTVGCCQGLETIEQCGVLVIG